MAEMASPPTASSFTPLTNEKDATPAKEETKKERERFHIEAGSTTFEALNRITCDNIALTNCVKLGDALYHLALAIGRSGEEMDEMGNISKRGINAGVAKLIHDFLAVKLDSPLRMAPANVGYDPMNPLFREGEAYSIPIDAEMVMILDINPKQPAVIHADDGNEPGPAGRR